MQKDNRSQYWFEKMDDCKPFEESGIVYFCTHNSTISWNGLSWSKKKISLTQLKTIIKILTISKSIWFIFNQTQSELRLYETSMRMKKDLKIFDAKQRQLHSIWSIYSIVLIWLVNLIYKKFYYSSLKFRPLFGHLSQIRFWQRHKWHFLII